MYFSIYHYIAGYKWCIHHSSCYTMLLVNTKGQQECVAAPVPPGDTAPAPGSWLLAGCQGKQPPVTPG